MVWARRNQPADFVSTSDLADLTNVYAPKATAPRPRWLDTLKGHAYRCTPGVLFVAWTAFCLWLGS